MENQNKSSSVGQYAKRHIGLFIPMLIFYSLFLTGNYVDAMLILAEYFVEGLNWILGLLNPIIDGFFG